MESEDDIFRKRQAAEGSKGGKLTLERYGKSHFSKIATKAWKKRKKAKKTKNGK